MRRIGSTQVGQIVGVSKWGNARDVYEDLVNGIRPAPKKVFERGNRYEDVLRETYRREMGPVSDAPCTRFEPLLHPTWEFASASPDGLAGDDTVVEYKTGSIWTEKDWGLPLTDEVPDTYLCQLAWCMAVTGRSVAHLLVGFGQDETIRRVAPVEPGEPDDWAWGEKPAPLAVDTTVVEETRFHITENRLFVVKRDLELERTLARAVQFFWESYVIPRKAPAMAPLGAIKRQLAQREKEAKNGRAIERQYRQHLGIGEGIGEGTV